MDDEKTFTQEEVSRIVRDRLATERRKYEKEYNSKMLNLSARNKLMVAGLNPDLADLFNLIDEDSIDNVVAAITESIEKETLAGTFSKKGPGYEPNGGAAIDNRIPYDDPSKPKDDAESIKKAMGL